MLAEKTLSGSYVTSTRANVISLERTDPLLDTCYPITIVFSIACFCMELRRILGWPRLGVIIDERDRCRKSTFVHFFLPLVCIGSYILYEVRYVEGADSLVTFNADKQIDKATIDNFYKCELLDKYLLAANLLILFMFNGLFFRYLLMYFPQLAFLSEMVGKLTKPLFFLLVIVGLFLFAFATLLYGFYSTKVEFYRNGLVAIISLFRFAHGGLRDWKALSEDNSIMYPVVMLVGLVFLTMVLNTMPIAIMASHKKEKDLYENYSYHTFWASERSKEGKDPKDFNPATIGLDPRDMDKRD